MSEETTTEEITTEEITLWNEIMVEYLALFSRCRQARGVKDCFACKLSKKNFKACPLKDEHNEYMGYRDII